MKFETPLLDWRRRSKLSAFTSAAIVAVAITCGSTQLHAQITWNGAGGDGNWLNGANWVGGFAPTGIADDAIVGAPSPVTLNGNVNINSLTVGADGIVNVGSSDNLDFGGAATTTLNNAGTINTANNSDIQFQNGVINSGNINIIAGANQTDIEIDALGATLDGGGTVTLSGINAGINGLSGSTLTIADQTIQGQGNIGENTIGIVNQANGLIDANVSGEILQIDANTAAGASNAGTMQASGGGTLRVTGTVVDNTDGQINAENGSEVRLNDSTITNGTLSSTGTGQLTIDESADVLLQNVAINGSLVSGNNSDTGVLGTINNTGTIEIQAGANQTDIEVQAAGATLTGGGTVTLSGSTAGINGTGALTIGNQTVEGEGSIGENSIGIVNSASGLIDANVATKTLTIDSSTSGGVDNNGVMQASNQGVLRILGSNVENDGGLIEAGADSLVTFNDSTIQSGTLNSVGTGQLEVESSANVRFQNVTNNGHIVSQDNSDTELLGTMNNTGTMEIMAGANQTDIEVQTGNATLTGGGTVKLSGINAGINGSSGTVLTIGDQTVEGQGAIGENAIGIVNSANGLVDANVSGEVLQIDADATNNFTNDGVLRASDGGVLRVLFTQMNNNNVIEALAGSKVEIDDSTITGGTLRSVGTGFVENLASSNTFLENLAFEGNMKSLNNSDTGILGTINNTGTMEILAGPNHTDIEVQAGGATLTGGGTVRLSGTNAGINGLTGTVLTIGDQTIEGQGTIGENAIGIVNSASGLVDANVSGEVLQIDADATSNFTNDGVLRASDGGVLRVHSTQMNNNNTIEALAGSKIELNASTITGGTLRSVDTGFVENLSSSNTFLENLTFDGNMRSLNNSDTGILGTINNTGTIEIMAGANQTDVEVQTGGATLTGGGTVRLSGANAGVNGFSGAVLDIASQIVIGQGSLGENAIDIFNGMGGTIEADVAGQSLTIDTAGSNITTFFTNDGTLRASNASILDSLQGVINNGTINTTIGSTVEARTLSNTNGSLISGDGFINVDMGVIEVAGTVAPGNSAGTLTLLDDTIFTSTAVLQTELESDSLFDILQVDGDLMLDGILEVSLLSSFNPLSTDVFSIVSLTEFGAEISGEFANAADGSTLLTTDGTGSFTVNYGSANVTLSNFSLTAVPEPSSTVCLIGLAVGLLIRRKRTV